MNRSVLLVLKGGSEDGSKERRFQRIGYSDDEYTRRLKRTSAPGDNKEEGPTDSTQFLRNNKSGVVKLLEDSKEEQSVSRD